METRVGLGFMAISALVGFFSNLNVQGKGGGAVGGLGEPKTPATVLANGSLSFCSMDRDSCRVTISSYGGGGSLARVASTTHVEVVAQLMPTPTPTPNGYIPYWVNYVPAPIANGNAAVGATFGAGILYNAVASPSATPLLDVLGACNFICFGSPGEPSKDVISYGNDVNPAASGGASYTIQGADDSCGILSECPGLIANQVYSVYSVASSPQLGYWVAVDGDGNLGVHKNIVAGAAVIAGLGQGSPGPGPEPTPNPGSLVSYTGASSACIASSSNACGDALLGNSSDFVKCDYGEVTTSMLTCSRPFVAALGLTSSAPITLGGVSSGYTFDCLSTLSAGCALLTHGTQSSLFIGLSASNLAQGGFLYNASNSIHISSGAYATGGSCCTATQTQASQIEVADNGDVIQFYYNSGLTPTTTFTPAPVAGINSSGAVWSTGGVQPNSASAGGSGGYAPEAFPVGVAKEHPRIMTGSCSANPPSTLCTFPNSFAFSNTSFTCRVSEKGSTPAASSYVLTSTTSITVSPSRAGTFTYMCIG